MSGVVSTVWKNHFACLFAVSVGFGENAVLVIPLPPIDTIWAMMIVWRTRGDHRTARAVLEAIIAFSAMHTYYEQLLQVKQICLCLTGFTSLCLDAYVFVFSCISLHACCIIVTWWGGPGGIEAWSDDWPSSFGALTLLVGSHDL